MLRDEDINRSTYDEGLSEGKIHLISPFNDYIDTILSMLNVKAIRNKHLKILLDPMFGVSKTSLQTILMSARCDVDVIHDRHDTMFGGRLPSPSAQTLTRLSDFVVEKNYDLGIGTDGDADRLGIIDELGDFIHPNKIMALLYNYLLEYKNGKVVLYETSRRPIYWMPLPKSMDKNAMRFQSVLNTYQPKCKRRMQLSVAKVVEA